MMAFSDLSKYKGEVAIIDALTPLKIIMIGASFIGFVGLIILIYAWFNPTRFELLFDKVSFSFKKRLFTFLDWLSVLPICVVITVGCFSYLFLIMQVSGPSMNPTLSNGDHVLVLYNKEVTRGSVVILEANSEDYMVKVSPTENWIKRVIGIPGDTVVWTDDCKLYINGKLYEEDYFPDNHFGIDNRSGFTFDGQFTYINSDGQIEKTFVIPEGYYFVMGDNRDNSKDSRHIGLIPEENIVGVATHTMNFIIPRGKIE